MKKILMVLIVLFILIIPNTKVYALEDSFYEGEYIPNTYMKKFRGSSGKYQQMRVFRRKSDDKAVYCIEMWEVLNSNKTIPGYDYDQYIHANINYGVWERIMLISYYGYGYHNHTDIKWYAITQFMIWKETSPDSNIYFTDKLNGNKIEKYQSEMNEIEELIRNHANIPSFYNQSYELKYNENHIVTDTNNVLEKFNITSNAGLEVTKNSNTLTVNKKIPGHSQLHLVNTDTIYKSPPVVYIDDSGQNLLLAGSYYPIYMVVNYELPSSSIKVEKLDYDTKNNIGQGDGKLSGSIFQLLDNNYQLIEEKTIYENNKLTFENIGYGNYYLKEMRPGEGYLLNEEIINIVVDEKVENIKFYNKVIKNKITFQKYTKNSLTGKIKEEENATFSIYKDNNKIHTFTTDKKGKYEIDLPYGTYLIKQVSGTKNHIYVDDFIIDINTNDKSQYFEMYNEEIVSNIKIINTDNDSNLPILEKGATFKIKNLDLNEYIKNDENNILILTTSDLGETNYLKLSSGSYCIEQITSVENYEINKNIFNFEISDNIEFKTDNNENYLEIVIPNNKQKSKIEIEKNIEYYLNDMLVKTEIDNNLEIDIYAEKDIYSKDGIKIYSKDELVTSVINNDNKLITESILLGNYYIKNPIDNDIIKITLNSQNNEKIILTEKVFEYEEEIEILEKEEEINENNKEIIDKEIKKENEEIVEEITPKEEIKVEYLNNKLNKEEIIIDVPNTLDKKSIFSNSSILIILIGLLIIGKEKKNENN